MKFTLSNQATTINGLASDIHPADVVFAMEGWTETVSGFFQRIKEAVGNTAGKYNPDLVKVIPDNAKFHNKEFRGLAPYRANLMDMAANALGKISDQVHQSMESFKNIPKDASISERKSNSAKFMERLEEWKSYVFRDSFGRFQGFLDFPYLIGTYTINMDQPNGEPFRWVPNERLSTIEPCLVTWKDLKERLLGWSDERLSRCIDQASNAVKGLAEAGKTSFPTSNLNGGESLIAELSMRVAAFLAKQVQEAVRVKYAATATLWQIRRAWIHDPSQEKPENNRSFF